MSLWLMEKCDWRCNNVANRHTQPYGIEGSHRFMGSDIYDNCEGAEDKFWEYVYRGNFEQLEKFWNMYNHIQLHSKNKCMLQSIWGNLQYKDMDGTFHLDGAENQTAFIMMLAYQDIEENMGGGFYHEPSGQNIPFKQGRVVEITASDKHKGLAFNVPHIPRFSLKFLGLNDEVSRIYKKG
jgi:hypothetical protein